MGFKSIDKWSVLAAIRFLLASIVAIAHLGDFTQIGRLGFVRRFGTFEAILGFLLISGYSISASYAKQPGGFLYRRILRLYPVYLAALVLTYVAFVVLKVPPPGPVLLLVNVLFLNQLVTINSFVGPAWTLSLEFWLYCLTPFFMSLSSRRTRFLVFASLTCYVIYTMLRTLAHMPYYSGVGFGLNLILLSFIWIAGLRLARADSDNKSALRDIGIIFGVHMFLTVAIQLAYRLKHHAFSEFVGHDIVDYVLQSTTLLFVYFVFKVLVISDRADLHRSRFLRLLGDISYPLYLLHAAVYALLAHFGLTTPALFYLIAVFVSVVVYWSLDFYSKKRHLQIGTA
jgi:peptidoglycan/LPS O-acetylase OafA/YrhL